MALHGEKRKLQCMISLSDESPAKKSRKRSNSSDSGNTQLVNQPMNFIINTRHNCRKQ